MIVTTTNIITLRPSTSVPTVKVRPSIWNQAPSVVIGSHGLSPSAWPSGPDPATCVVLSGRDLSRGHRDDEQGEDLTDDIAVQRAEGDEVDVDGVEDQLDRHEDHDAVASRQHAVHADGEQSRAEEQELVDQHDVGPWGEPEGGGSCQPLSAS